MDLCALFQGLHPSMTPTTLRQLPRLAFARLVRTGRVTMRGISRWAGQGGSDRTVQRLFAQARPWALLVGVCCRQHVYRPGDGYLLAGDDVVVTTAGPHPYGLERGFARRSSQGVPGVSCCALAGVSIQERRSCPIRVAQRVRRAGRPTAGLRSR